MVAEVIRMFTNSEADSSIIINFILLALEMNDIHLKMRVLMMKNKTTK